jgi:hypothetical protein
VSTFLRRALSIGNTIQIDSNNKLPRMTAAKVILAFFVRFGVQFGQAVSLCVRQFHVLIRDWLTVRGIDSARDLTIHTFAPILSCFDTALQKTEEKQAAAVSKPPVPSGPSPLQVAENKGWAVAGSNRGPPACKASFPPSISSICS